MGINEKLTCKANRFVPNVNVCRNQRTRVVKSTILGISVTSTTKVNTDNMDDIVELEGDFRAKEGGGDAEEGKEQERD